jgi:hypothetical protein
MLGDVDILAHAADSMAVRATVSPGPCCLVLALAAAMGRQGDADWLDNRTGRKRYQSDIAVSYFWSILHRPRRLSNASTTKM